MTRGGARKGAGRKPVDPRLAKVPTGYKLPRWLKQWLGEQDRPAAQLIEEALCHRYNINAPEIPAGGNKNGTP